jgi:transcriptional regulator with XRE-family HTH domain
MVIGDKLKKLREERNMTQGDVFEKTGLLRVYLSRLENGRTTPSVDTLEKLAAAYEIPMYQLFVEEGTRVEKPDIPGVKFGRPKNPSKQQDKELRQFAKAWSRMNERQRMLLYQLAAKLARHPRKSSKNRAA